MQVTKKIVIEYVKIVYYETAVINIISATDQLYSLGKISMILRIISINKITVKLMVILKIITKN